MNVVYIEYLVFALIGLIQVRAFMRTRQKISEFNKAMPDIDDILLVDYNLTAEEIERYVVTGSIDSPEEPAVEVDPEDFSSEEESDESEQLKNQQSLDFEADEKTYALRVVGTKRNIRSAVFSEIQVSINKYLLRNRHAPADFNLIKDIVERNTDALEEDINLTISTPLYLGLMGTMLGIVIGLFSMAGISNAAVGITDESVGILLNSVKIAMIASCFGLLLTVYNSALVFKGTKAVLDAKKNRFYTFIQVQLLPSLNQGIGATFESLQRNLSKFNEKFDNNLDRLSSVFDKNYESILLQKELLTQLDRNKVADITKYNVQVLKELSIALKQFDKFNFLFNNLNKYVDNSYLLTDKTNELLERTGNFEVLANTFTKNISETNQLVSFLTGHFETLESHKQKVDEALSGVSFGIKDTFDELKEAINAISQSVSVEAANRSEDNKKVFEDFTTELKNTFEDQARIFGEAIEEKKSSLDYLQHLEPMLAEVKSNNGLLQDQLAKMDRLKFGAEEPSSNGKLYSEFVVLTGLVSGTNDTLKNIEVDLKTPFFKKYFRTKKASNEER